MHARTLSLSLMVVISAACSSKSIGGAPPPDDFDGSLFGLVVDPSAPPSADALRTLGARWVRVSLVAGKEDALDATLHAYRCLGARTLVVVDRTSFASTTTIPKDADDAAWSIYAARFAASAEAFVRAHDSEIDAVEIWNEPDLPADDPEAHPSSKHFALVMLDAYPRLKRILFDRPVIQGAISGPSWPSYLDDVVTRLANASILVDGFAFHPYGLRANGYPSTWPPNEPGVDGAELSNVVVEVSYTANAHNPPSAATRAIWLTEIGLPPSDAPDGVAPFVKNLFGTTETDPGGAHVLQALRDEGLLVHAFWLGWSDGSNATDPLGKKMFSPLADGSSTTNDAGKTYASQAGEIPACGHASDSGADAAKTLADLGDDEKAKLCDWTASTQGGYGKAYLCDGASTSIAKANVGECVASIPRTCAATVAQTEGCVKAVVATGDPCQVLARPECAAVRRCDWRAGVAAADPYFAISADNATFGPPQANVLASLGVGMVRLAFDHWDAQRDALLARVDAAIAAHMHVLVELNYASTGDLDGDGTNCDTACQVARQHRWHDGYTPAGNAYAQKFAAMAASVAKAVKPHLLGTTVRYEIWNEPDAPPNRNDGSTALPSQSTADWDGCTSYTHEYGVLYDAGQWALCPQQLGVITTNAYFAIKNEDPDALVVAGNVILQGDDPLGWVAHDYWSYVEKSDAVQYALKTIHHLPWDEVGFHPYARVPVDADLGAALTYFSSALEDAGDGSPIALTEYGWSTNRAPNAATVTSPENQAAYLSQVYALARAYGVSFVSWFDYLSTTEDFGLRDPMFSTPDDGTQGWKPAASAYCRSASAKACPAH